MSLPCRKIKRNGWFDGTRSYPVPSRPFTFLKTDLSSLEPRINLFLGLPPSPGTFFAFSHVLEYFSGHWQLIISLLADMAFSYSVWLSPASVWALEEIMSTLFSTFILLSSNTFSLPKPLYNDSINPMAQPMGLYRGIGPLLRLKQDISKVEDLSCFKLLYEVSIEHCPKYPKFSAEIGLVRIL